MQPRARLLLGPLPNKRPPGCGGAMGLPRVEVLALQLPVVLAGLTFNRRRRLSISIASGVGSKKRLELEHE